MLQRSALLLQVGEDGKPVVYTKAKLGEQNKMYYNEEVLGAEDLGRRQSFAATAFEGLVASPDLIQSCVAPVGTPCSALSDAMPRVRLAWR
jgi:hypothetical protein